MDKICTLIIKDECNIKFDGLDPVVRREMVNSLKFEVPGARYMPSVRMGRWDGKQSFCGVGGSSFINALPVLLPIVQDAGYEIQIEDLRSPFGVEFTEATTTLFDEKVWPEGHELEGEPIILRDYQVDCINHYLRDHQCVQEISTGAGKTILTAALSYLVEKETGGRTIVIVPNKDLVKQTEVDYINVGLDVGVYYGDRKNIGSQHTICTWQSLNNLNKMGDVDGLNVIEAFLDGVNTVICDECFDGETLITTPNGHTKIKDIKIGDKIINYNEETKSFKEDEVIDVYENMTKSSNEKMYELEFDNETVIKVTGNHKFLTKNRGWVRADELTENDNIVNISDMNPRSKRLVENLNDILEENKKQLKVLYTDSENIILSGNKILDYLEKIKFIRRVKTPHYLKFIDELYGFDLEKTKEVEIYLIQEGARKGGLAVQQQHGDKIKENLNTGEPWNKGMKGQYHIIPCSEETKKKIGKANSGENNGMYGISPSKEQRERQSKIMKEKILNGEFTPNVHNSLTRKDIEYNGQKYRSSWEVVFAHLNPDYEYEKIRIKYKFEDKDSIYIVDFVDYNKRHLIEIKPASRRNDPRMKAKEQAALKWAVENEFKYEILDETFIIQNKDNIKFEEIDKEIVRRIKSVIKT